MQVVSAKNKLQEYYQKKKLPLPVYETYPCEDTKTLTWQSVVKLHNNKTVLGQYCGSKTAAEISAAEIALDDLLLENKKSKRSVAPRTVLLVDIENMPKLINEVVEEIDNIDIYGFVSYNHCLSQKELPEGATKIIVPCSRKDGTDTYLQIFIGYLLALNKYDIYLIGTRDHYGDAIVDIINNSEISINKNAYVITSASHIL